VALCPICTFVTALEEVRPELAEHLVLAGREILLSIRALIDARLEGPRPDSEGATTAGTDGPGDDDASRASAARPASARPAPRRTRRTSSPSPLERIDIG
jgi:hypothetical protein